MCHSCAVLILCIFQYSCLTKASKTLPVIIRGQNEFVPCTYERDSSELRAHILSCDEEASKEFGNQLPIIKADQIPLSQIRIRGTVEITTCPNWAFQDVNLDVDRGRGQLGTVVRRVEISGTRLVHIEPHCLDGLFTVQELRILNAPGSENSNQGEQLTNNLFRGLHGLRSLQFLHLVHIDLSAGIPAQGFGNWTDELRFIHLERNRLGSIHPDAFDKSRTYPSVLKELRIEGQPEAWRLLTNMRQWARDLISLRTLSWRHSQLQPPIGGGTIRVDLGKEVNSKLITLVMDNCNLLRLVYEKSTVPLAGISLDALGPYLQELSVNYNRFASMETLNESLAGLRVLSQLQLLSIEYNKTPLNRLPEWFSHDGLNQLRELRLKHSGLTTIMRKAFPPLLERLHLSANPLRYVDAEWMGNNRQSLVELHLNHIRLASVDVGGYWADWARALKPIAGTLRVLSLAGCQIEPDVLEPPPIASRIAHIVGLNNVMNETKMRPAIRMGLNNLKHLQTLVLNDNELTHIPVGAFRDLISLRHLVLAGNLLGSIAESGRNKPLLEPHSARRHRLQRLDLRFNRFQTLDRCVIAFGLGEPLEEILPKRPIWLAGERSTNANNQSEPRASEIQHDPTTGLNEWFGGLSLTGNSFICDCRLAWLRLYINQMDQHVRESMLNHSFPPGYQTYRTEALDFVCAEVGPWQGRKFLTLKPTDLYAIRHEHCQKYPKVYGDGMQIEKALIPCRKVMTRYGIDGKIIPRGRMFFVPEGQIDDFSSRWNKGSNRTKASAARKNSVDTMGISLEAFILVIVASVASLCFLIISLIIILCLCFRLKRQEASKKQGKYEGRRGKNPLIDCCNSGRLSRCCSGRIRYSAGTNVTVSSNSTTGTTVLKPAGALHDSRDVESGFGLKSVIPSEVGTVYEDPVESCYSQMSEPEFTTSAIVMHGTGTAKPIPMKRKTKRQLNLPHQITTNIAGGRNGCELSLARSHVQTTNEVVHFPLNGLGADAQSTVSLNRNGRILPRSAPLPPVPKQRKTKSIADISINLVNNDWRPHATPMRSPHDPRQPNCTTSLNALFDVSDDCERHPINSDSTDLARIGPQLRPKHWHDASTTNRHTDGSISSSGNNDSSSFSRTRQTRSTGSRNPIPFRGSPTDQSSRWCRTSRKRLERSLEWLRRHARKNGRSSRASGTVSNDEDNSTMNEQLQQQEDEESKRMQGPDLPRPRFVMVPKTPTVTHSNQNFEPRHDYLPMQTDTNNSDSVSSAPLIAHTPVTKPDEYVTEFAELPMQRLRHQSKNNRPSHSDDDSLELPLPVNRRPVSLADNLYTISLYDEAPETPTPEPEDNLDFDLPPPPPPPPLSRMMMHLSPGAWENAVSDRFNRSFPKKTVGNDPKPGQSFEVMTSRVQQQHSPPPRPPPPPIGLKSKEVERRKPLLTATKAESAKTTPKV